MGWRLTAAGARPMTSGFVKRFDPRFWTVNFPRPMMASVTTSGADSLAVDAVFYRKNDLAGLIWEATDVWDHPLLAYETDRDFRGLTLSFRWRSSGVLPLDAVNGPTLTIEGRDAGGAARAWYVRLWNYATGDPEDAEITLDFDALDGGFLLPGEADPVWAGDIDRMFISLVAPDYVNVAEPLTEPVEGRVILSGIKCDGARSVLAIGETMVPAHGLRIATGYDDSYNLTPARVLRNMLQLGYRGPINHYVGMSHYFRLVADEDVYRVHSTGGVLNNACAAWHADFAERAGGLGYGLIPSLSYELLDQHCPDGWKQRAADGSPGLTGWDPPSALLSPAHGGAMAYLQAVARAFVGIALAAGQDARFQIGEPWWWVMPDGRPCLYDDTARAAFGGSPVAIANVRATLSAAQKALLDQAGALLATSTLALRDAVRAAAPGAEVLLLAYMPGTIDAVAPEVRRANLPLGWVAPAFDVLQLEDYDWVIAGDTGATERGLAAVAARLGYPTGQTHYLSGFVLHRAASPLWAQIDAAAEAARGRGHAETFIWALPQVIRDGFVHFDIAGEEEMDAFDEVDFPIAIGRTASAEPGFSTAVVTSASGAEQRNADWAQGRLRFDAGPGVRSQADIEALLAFFRARRGRAKGFRFRDPLDDSSNGMTGAPGFADVALGVGDGVTTRFALVKRYGDGAEAERRRITRPVAGSVRGYAASGDSVRGAIEGLVAAYPLSIHDDGATLRIDPATSIDIDPAQFGATVDEREAGRENACPHAGRHAARRGRDRLLRAKPRLSGRFAARTPRRHRPADRPDRAGRRDRGGRRQGAGHSGAAAGVGAARAAERASAVAIDRGTCRAQRHDRRWTMAGGELGARADGGRAPIWCATKRPFPSRRRRPRGVRPGARMIRPAPPS